MAHNQAAAQASSQSSSLPAPEASQGLGPGDIRRHCSEDQHAASSLVMLHKGIKQGEGVEVPATGSEDSGTMPDGSNSPPAERVKRRRTQLTPPASPAATKETADATAAGVESGLAALLNQSEPASLHGFPQMLQMLRQLVADVHIMRTHQHALMAMIAANLVPCQQVARCTNRAFVQVSQQQQVQQPRNKAEAARRKRQVTNEAHKAKAQRAHQRAASQSASQQLHLNQLTPNAVPSQILGPNLHPEQLAALPDQASLPAAEPSNQLPPLTADSAELHQLQQGRPPYIAPAANAAQELKNAMQTQWDGWEGTYRNLSAYSIAALHRPGGSLANGDDLLLLLSDWELGILVGDRRTPPLWRLELAMRQAGSYRWRCGNRISKQVQQRKLLIYHILRTAGHSRADILLPPGDAQTACASISASRTVCTKKANGTAKTTVLSLDKLSKQLMNEEMEVAKFEEDVFGWPKHACQVNGNPRKRKLGS
ncbi:hypothetical protein WJX74_005230 [Apatococcus lobatus]|uniref:Uncharacterized protein n=1 Tax=Apatococcus lobatus TaxID=904363 RepID=A0AAW1QVK6_9CHLO